MGDDEKKSRVLQKLRRELGPAVLRELDDPRTIELMLNPDGTLWVEKLGEPMRPIGTMERASAEAMLATLASWLDTVINRDNPILEGELPIHGARFEGITAPVVPFPSFTIRKKATAIFTLNDYVIRGIMTEEQRDVLLDAIRLRNNILVVGGTGTGKTTLTNALIDAMTELTPDHRILILEDTAEIQCKAKNVVTMRTSETVTLRQLLRVCMRMRPDRILVGETRGGEALDLLKAWNTGHPGGFATVHANSATAGLVRLEQLISEVSSTPMPHLIAEAVNLVVGIAKHGNTRRIEGIFHVRGYENGRYLTDSIAVNTPPPFHVVPEAEVVPMTARIPHPNAGRKISSPGVNGHQPRIPPAVASGE